jgi:hypothetical protein
VILGVVAGCWLIFTRLGYPELEELNLTLRRGFLEQRKIIAQRVYFRKLVDSLQECGTLSLLWFRILELAKAFDFDSIELSLCPPSTPQIDDPKGDGEATHLRRYWKEGSEQAFREHPEHYWKIEIPLCGHPPSRCYTVFLRALDKPQLDLRMESFVSEISSKLSKGIAKAYHARH